MEDDDAQYDSYEVKSDGIGDIILYPLIASVFSVFILISIGAFLLSNKRCCLKRRHDDAESALLKERLLNEQKKMLNYKFKLPFRTKPIFSSVMQQEENEIAQEVQESYKTISTDASKSIFCCPNNKTSYIYHPQCNQSPDNGRQSTPIDKTDEAGETAKSKSTKKTEQILFDNALDFSPDGKTNRTTALSKVIAINEKPEALHCFKTEMESDDVHCDIDSLVSQEYDQSKEDIFDNDLFQHYDHSAKIINKIFTESEINNTPNLKSLLFEKWLNNEIQDNESVQKSLYDGDQDDLDSILTSISRMNSTKMHKLKSTTFYKNLISEMNSRNTRNNLCDEVDDEFHDEDSLNDIISYKIGNYDDSNMTHEEVMQAVITPEHVSKYFSDVVLKTAKPLVDPHPQSDSSNSTISYLNEPTEEDTDKSLETQEFASPSSAILVDTSSQLTSDTKTLSSRQSTTTDSIFSRPTSLDLKRRNTDLKIDFPLKLDNFKAKFPISNSSIMSSETMSFGSSSTQSSTTTWKEIETIRKKKETEKRKSNPTRRKRSNNNLSANTSKDSSSSAILNTTATTTTATDISKKFRTPKKYKSPRKMRLKTEIIAMNQSSDSEESSDSKYYSSKSNNIKKVDTNVSSKQLPKFVTGSMQNKPRRK